MTEWIDTGSGTRCSCQHQLELVGPLIYGSRSPLTSSSGGQSSSLSCREIKPFIHWQDGEGLGGGKRLQGRLITSTNFHYTHFVIQQNVGDHSMPSIVSGVSGAEPGP